MPFGTEGRGQGVGLALSGGGFRATLFHLGSLRRLNELGYFPLLERVSSISGGSITAGLLGLRWRDLTFRGDRAVNLDELIIQPLRSFCSRTVDVAAVGEGMFSPSKSAADVLEETYDEHLFHGARLGDLPDRPRFVLNATNCGTGVSFRFSKPYVGDYRIGLIRDPDFRIATAVAASSAFPPVLSPVVIEVQDPGAFERTGGADLYDQVHLRERLVLTDGGVYDNLGLETVWGRYATVLVSDAGAPFTVKYRSGEGWIDQTSRAMDIATNQARGLRKRVLIQELQEPGCGGAYWGIMTPIAKYHLSDSLPCPPEVTKELAGIRTRLDSFNEREQCRLINWGYAVCDAAMRRHVAPQAASPEGWPFPAYALG